MASPKTKTKAGLSETTPSKSSSPATPRITKLSRGVAKSEANVPSPTQNPRLSTDRASHSASSKPSPSSSERSPHSANSKPSTERRSPKVLTPTEKTRARVVTGSELQTRLSQIQEELKKSNEQIVSLEKEKAKALDKLKEAQKEADEAIKKLDESLAAQKKAEENSEIEKFQAVDAGIEVSQRNEEEWKKELENMKNQRALDSSALRSVSEELENVKQDLVAAIDAKSKALSRADDASKMADAHAEKVEILSSELIRLKALLDSTRERETLSTSEISSKLSSEIEVLRGELEKARSLEAEIKEREMIIEQLNVELEAAKMAESSAHSSVEEWKVKAKELEERLDKASELERSASASLESVLKQLEGSNDRLHEAVSEIADLKKKVGSLEITAQRQKEDLEESERHLGIAKEEFSKFEKEVEKLKKELETVEKEKDLALKSEQDAASSVERLMGEKNKLISELERSKEEEEKSKKAMESLASALHEVSTEARELKEKLLNQGDHEYETQIEDLKLVIKATNEKYETMLDEARHEIDVLVSAVEQTKKHFESSKGDWEMKEANLVNNVKKMEEEVASMGKEMNRLSNLLKRTEEEANAAEKRGSQMENHLKEAEDEVIYLQENLAEAKAESMKLKENLLDKETEFQGIVHENEELRVKEEVSLKKIEELTKLLEEALAKNQREENGELSESEKDYDLLPKVVEFSEENGHRSGEDKSSKVDNLDETPQEDLRNGLKDKDANGKPEEKKEDSTEDDSVEDEFKMWESCQIEKKEAFPDKKSEQECPEEEGEGEEDLTKIDESDKTSTENIDETGNALSAEEQQDKKKKKKSKQKKTLFGKVGNLLKKKGPVNSKITVLDSVK
ncbi:PREDICTED: WEB family protein At5g16730, chloroplastic-like isoform X2 [Tarenaya hassleriana]|uniref:WEB family protein At5g16730, chloroplastic-like isoform X2 n=1 Tax=Tarenaya hassleriana TaxID=28532 RepID=UPI00053C8F75|nr:PREDICTED: WEB family protein At5g16730, chloroplastic-like isoform X2 [Tarenaya hassleriana]